MKNGSIGTRELSAWLVAPGVCWIQAREPKHARRLAQRRDARLVARGVAGGFLRTFEIQKGLTWAAKLIARYVADEAPTNERFLSLKSRRTRRNPAADSREVRHV